MISTPASKAASKDFFRRLAKMKQHLGYDTNRQLAHFIGQPESTVRGWMRGQRPSVEKIAAVEAHLRLRMDIISEQSQAIHNFLPVTACE